MTNPMKDSDEWLDDLLDDFGHAAANGGNRTELKAKAKQAIQAHYQAQAAENDEEIVREIFFKHRHTCGKPGDVCSCFDRQEADMVIREMTQLLTERQQSND